MKRFLSAFLSIMVMVTMLVLPVSANTPTVTVESITEAKTFGDEVKLEVSVSNNPGLQISTGKLNMILTVWN